MDKDIKKYLIENELSVKGIKELVDMTEEERVKKYGKNYYLLVTKCISHKQKVKDLWSNKVNEIDIVIKELKDVAHKIGLGGY